MSIKSSFGTQIIHVNQVNPNPNPNPSSQINCIYVLEHKRQHLKENCRSGTQSTKGLLTLEIV